MLTPLQLISRLVRRLFFRAKMQREISDELRHHLDMLIDANVRAGMNRRDAEEAARREFGGDEQIKEVCSDVRGMRWIEYFGRDLAAAVRSLLRSPVYLAVSAGVLGISIAAQVAMLAIADAVIVSPPTAREPERLAVIRSLEAGGQINYPDFLDIRDTATAFERMFAYRFFTMSVSSGSELAEVKGGVVSGQFFPALGAAPARGRLLDEKDDAPGAEPVMVLSAGLAERLGASLDQLVTINKRSFRVVGILPADFRAIDRDIRAEVWIPLVQGTVSIGEWVFANRNFQWLRAGGRLKDERTLAEADAELQVIAADLQRAYPLFHVGSGLRADTLPSHRLAQNRSARTIVFLVALTWLLFALAFTNFFALALLRMFSRRRELAVRLALGAGRANLACWLLGELVIVVGCAMALGYGLGVLGVRLMGLDPVIGRLMTTASVQLDLRAMSVVLCSTLAGALGVWLLLLRQASRVDLVTGLKESATAPRRQVVSLSLFAVQLSIAFLLLTVAVSFVGALRDAVNCQYPFRTERIVLMTVNPTAVGINGRLPARDFMQRWIERVAGVPGVVDVGVCSSMPLADRGSTNVMIDDRDPALSPDKNLALRASVSEDYFRAAGLPLRSGREFTGHEVGKEIKVVIVNAAFARRFWPGENAVGKYVKPWQDSVPCLVVGVAEDAPVTGYATVPPVIYNPIGQSSFSTFSLSIAVRDDTPAMRQALQDAVRDLWPYRILPPMVGIEEYLGTTHDELISAVRVVSWISGVAMVIVGLGLYFFSSYTAALGMRDAAVRLALGSSRSHVLWTHVKKYRWALLCGLAGGAALIAVFPHVFSRAKIEIVPTGWVDGALAAALLVLIAAAGLCAPLWRLNRLDISRVLNRPE